MRSSTGLRPVPEPAGTARTDAAAALGRPAPGFIAMSPDRTRPWML